MQDNQHQEWHALLAASYVFLQRQQVVAKELVAKELSLAEREQQLHDLQSSIAQQVCTTMSTSWTASIFNNSFREGCSWP
jgi:hypothetical protein